MKNEIKKVVENGREVVSCKGDCDNCQIYKVDVTPEDVEKYPKKSICRIGLEKVTI